MVYKILCKIEGDMVEVGSRDNLADAKRLLEAFKEHWPGDYTIQDTTSGCEVDLDD